MKKETIIRQLVKHRLAYRVALNAYERYETMLRIRNKARLEPYQKNLGQHLDTSRIPDLNVVIIVIDCLRNSHLSCQGYHRRTTPFLDSLKSKFSAISAASWTYPSVASMLSGLYPHNHGAVLAGVIKDLGKPETYRKMRDDIHTLPEILSFLGYRTFFGADVALAAYPFRGRLVPKRNDLLNELRKWIYKRKGETFFAYVHLGNMHEPLVPPIDFRDFFGEVRNLPNIKTWDFLTPEQQQNDAKGFKEYKDNKVLLYDNTLRYVDHLVEGLYTSLKDMNLINETIFMVTADHGEELWEHTETEAKYFYHPRGRYGVGHGYSVFNEVIEVPLLISCPTAIKDMNGFVSTADITPTILDLLGVVHDFTFDGCSIREIDRNRPLLSEATSWGYEKKALFIGSHKLIKSVGDRIEWLFDLDKDPTEQHPIVDKHVTSIFVDKLDKMLMQHEKRKIRQISKRAGLLNKSNRDY